jgi:hypothetical protein
VAVKAISFDAGLSDYTVLQIKLMLISQMIAFDALNSSLQRGNVQTFVSYS